VTDNRVIERFLRYSRAFETLDPQAVLPFYHEPCLFISAEGVVSLPTRSDVAAFFREVMKNLSLQGYRTSEFEGLKAASLSQSLAVVTGVGIWRRADGSELRRFGLTYTLYDMEAGWEIAVAAVHDPKP